MNDLVFLFVAIPLGAAFLSLLFKAAAPRLAPWVTLLSTIALLVLSLTAVLGAHTGVSFAGDWGMAEGSRFVVGIALVLDGLSGLFLLLISVVSTAVVIFGLRYIDELRGTAALLRPLQPAGGRHVRGGPGRRPVQPLRVPRGGQHRLLRPGRLRHRRPRGGGGIQVPHPRLGGIRGDPARHRVCCTPRPAT